MQYLLTPVFIRRDFKRMTHYIKLKQKASEAIIKRKIFTVKGKNAMAARKALLDRGWVEKLPINSNENNFKLMPIDKQEKIILSSFLAKCNPHLAWGGIDISTSNAYQKWQKPIINNLDVNELWSTKDILCKSLQDYSWYYIENVAEVNVPRTYSNASKDELEDFIKDYLLTACTSLLKWIEINIENSKPVFTKTGTVSTSIIVFAINRCKEFLFMKENMDIDKQICNEPTGGQWKFFLTKYISIISGKDLFQANEDRNMPILLAYAKCLIDRIVKYRPQISCEGYCDTWIVKPSESSSGSDVIVSSDLTIALNMLTRTRETYIVQKYIGKKNKNIVIVFHKGKLYNTLFRY